MSHADLRTVTATRYVTPLREGGSLPAIVEADDLGFYVLKFRGAGQGPLALVAELIAGEIGRALGLKVPELVLVEVDPALGRNEEDSGDPRPAQGERGLEPGARLPAGIDHLRSRRHATPSSADLASAAVWFDAFVTNVDRTPRNPNLLWWHRVLYLIDHGAALYFHHNWPATEPALETAARSRFPAIRDHVLLPWASRIEEADQRLRPLLSEELFARIVDQIPEEWLSPDPAAAPPAGRRAGYVDFLTRRLAAASLFVEEAVRARAQLV